MRLFLLIFVVLIGTGATAVDELIGPNGGKRLFQSYDGLYLTEDMAHRRAITRGWGTCCPEIAQRKVRHDYFGAMLKDRVNEWELLTPVKNEDGSWSFKSRFNKWLSASRKDGIVGFMPENKDCEQWWMESWE